MRVYIKTYGCQMNERDSEAIAAALTAAGHTISTREDEADALLFNTCSVRDAAERKAKGKLSYLRKLKRERPEVILGVMGCMAQRLGDKLFAELPHLDFVLGTGQLHTLVPLLESIAADRHQVSRITESPEVLTRLGGHTASPDCRGQIAITRGCNRFCSYCIVPYVRGREISRPAADIVAEAKEMTASGVREILLLGQNVAAYGLGGNTSPPAPDHSPFAELLEELAEIPELYRIRFTSPYITYFNDRLIAALASTPKICNQLHLPLQSGSDRILAAMNRQYTAASYLEKVAQLKAAIPGLTLSTDVIVGFPGEEEEDFHRTRELMNEVGFEQAYIFKYSPRPGAKSAELVDSVPDAVKQERNAILLDDLARRVAGKLRTMVGERVEVLVEGVSARNAARWSGRTTTNITVHFEPVPDLAPGQLRQIEVTRAGEVTLFGEVR